MYLLQVFRYDARLSREILINDNDMLLSELFNGTGNSDIFFYKRGHRGVKLFSSTLGYARQGPTARRRFDSTLGYPGEGPDSKSSYKSTDRSRPTNASNSRTSQVDKLFTIFLLDFLFNLF